MKEIQLSRGKTVLVDDQDYAYLSQWNWHWHPASNNNGNGYAMRRGSIRMHREILGAKKGDIVDHINGNGCDNRRENLRICSASESSQNVRPYGISGYKGVYVSGDKWQAMIRQNGKLQHLGVFVDSRAAAVAYDTAAKEIYGANCKTNF
jgi:hypothetical protein